eukprot:GFUD01036035.1.p1 GENE.GFUD01036035.1~~GFUD01036035.1.p1  ORF type:complete len:466 (-),score=140.92 GFUD01036035.1:55-1452(-)
MSMTSQKTRSNALKSVKNLIQTGNWSKTFPSKIETETKSCVFVKKLLTVSISNITYLRSMFPEEAYADRSMDGLPLKILMVKNKCKEAATLASWLIGAFDALERRYLKELLFIIYMDPACPEKVYEMYTFKFTYPGGQVACQMLQGENKKEVQTMHPDDVYKSTQNLLRSIIELTQSLRPPPSSAHLSMKVTYYEDVTPEDYEPAGFGPADHGEVQLLPGSLHLGAGEVSTGHHTVKLKVHAMQVEETRDQPTIVTNTFSASASESDSDPRVVNESEVRKEINSLKIPSPSFDTRSGADPTKSKPASASKRKLKESADFEVIPKKISAKEKEAMIPPVLKTESVEVSPPDYFKCNICPKKFTSAAPLSTHLERHYSPLYDTWDCPFLACSFSASQTNLTKHMRSKHTKELLFPCNHCPAKFHTMEAKKAHKKKHIQTDIWAQCQKPRCLRFYQVIKGSCSRCSRM